MTYSNYEKVIIPSAVPKQPKFLDNSRGKVYRLGVIQKL
jgi:hypothetical protein